MNSTGTVATTAAAIRCCLGTSVESNDTIPLDNVKILISSKNMNANKNSFHAIINTYKATDAIAGTDNGIEIFRIICHLVSQYINPAS